MKHEEQRIAVVIVGHGKLANAISTHLPELDRTNGYIRDIQNYDEVTDTDTTTILIHVGSGRQYHESLSWAVHHHAAFIQAATVKAMPMVPPDPGKVVYIHAPNMDIHLMKLLYWLSLGAKLFQHETMTMTESHQATKTSVPGTAYKMCNILGIATKDIQSIRDPAIQQTLNITTLNQHAYHEIVIGSQRSHIKLITKVEGIIPYIEGLYKILKTIPNMPVNNYEVEDLIAKEYVI